MADAVSRWHDQADQRLFGGQRVMDPIAVANQFGLCRDAQAPQVIVQRAFAGDHGVGLRVGVVRGAFPMHAPVIEHPGHVVDLVRPDALDEAQRDVVVLGTLQALAEAADRLEDVGAIGAEMRHQVVRVEQVRVPVALEVRIPARPGFVELVLVRIDQAEVRMAICGLGDAEQGILAQHVVVVEQPDPFAGREFERRVRCRRDVAVAAAEAHLDPGVLVRVPAEDRTDLGIGRGVVGHAQFPVRVELGAHGFDRLDQPGGLRVEGRKQDGDQRPPGQGFDARPDARAVGFGERVVGLHPARIGRAPAHEVDELADEPGRAAPLQGAPGRRSEPAPVGAAQERE